MNLKRLFDLTLSCVTLCLLAPLFGVIAVGILLSSRGSIFFVQERLGQGGRIFKCYKFRTMGMNAEKELELLLCQDPLHAEEWRTMQKLQADPRIFPFGKFLRQSSLDELPQFFNVLKGDLSLVGPRPYLVSQREEMGSALFKILSVPPGITGLWQVTGRGQTTFKERLVIDLAYVDSSSFLLDLKLLLKTIPACLLRRNAT